LSAAARPRSGLVVCKDAAAAAAERTPLLLLLPGSVQQLTVVMQHQLMKWHAKTAQGIPGQVHQRILSYQQATVATRTLFSAIFGTRPFTRIGWIDGIE